MDLYATYGQIDLTNELWIKNRYDEIASIDGNGYSLVTIALKRFDDYSHLIGSLETETAIHICFDKLAACLEEDEYIVRIHSCLFNLLIKCEASEDGLHPRASAFHFAVRDAMEERYGRRLYLEMGFYPMIKPGIDFYCAQYYADLCRRASSFARFLETSYDMYYVSFVEKKEEFIKYEKMVLPALEHGDFKLFLQPKINVATGNVEGAEALMRWIDPEQGMIPLSSFLPSLEENGFIRDVDLYLFNVACGYLDKWLNQYGKHVTISFNMSQAYFIGDFFMPEYSSVFEKYNIPGSCVQIEFLESIVLNDLEHLKPLVQKIYDYGFTCALDDFGSGFSSFDVLTNTDMSVLKIDRSLFQNIHNSRERSLIKLIVDSAHEMGMVTVAEGIETEEYADYLKSIGCDYIQGFLYYRPMPVDEFEQRFILSDECTKENEK